MLAQQAPRGRKPPRVSGQFILSASYIGLVAIIFAMSFAHLGAVARPLYIAAGLAFAYYYSRRSPWQLVTILLWFWIGTAFVRRIIEWKSGFNASDVVLLVPNVMSLFLLPDILRAKGLFRRREFGYGLVVAGAILYGTANSFVRGDLIPGMVETADWLIPLFFYFYILVHAADIENAEAEFSQFLFLNFLVIVPYAIYQYFYMPQWDAMWMVQSGMGSVGEPLPVGSRVFGTTNNPGFLAGWIGTGMLLSRYFTSKLLNAMLPLLVFLMALTLVRSVQGATVVAFIVSAVIGRMQIFKTGILLGLSCVLMFAALTLVDPIVSEHIVTRFNSVSHLDEDDSAQTRRDLWAQTPELISENPMGLGIGAIGRGAVATGNPKLVSVDSGPLAIYLSLGWAVGTFYLGGILLIVLQCLLNAKRLQSQLMVAMASASLCTLLVLPFVNVVGFMGVLMWMCLGYATALGVRLDAKRRPSDPGPRLPPPVMAPIPGWKIDEPVLAAAER